MSAAIGFIALFGISVMDGIIILSQYNQLVEAGLERTAAVLRTGELQMRPVLMTCVIAGVGLLPAAMSTRHRLAGPKAAGGGRGRRHDAGADRHPDHLAGADHAVLATRANAAGQGRRRPDVRTRDRGVIRIQTNCCVIPDADSEFAADSSPALSRRLAMTD